MGREEGEDERGGKEGEKKEKGEINSRADFRLPPRGRRGDKFKGGYAAAPERREEGGGGRRVEAKRRRKRRGEINSRADFRLPPRGGERGRIQGRISGRPQWENNITHSFTWLIPPF